jgi:uncharacterized tellurite resistance protein B-like protein
MTSQRSVFTTGQRQRDDEAVASVHAFCCNNLYLLDFIDFCSLGPRAGATGIESAYVPVQHLSMHPDVARCHLLAEVLAADGIMVEEERVLLETEMERLQLSAPDRDAIRHFEGATEAMATAAALSQDDRQALVDHLVSAALIDGKLSPAETATVKRIAHALKLGM